MQIGDLMTPDPMVCSPKDSLRVAANRMWSGDCGVLPVVDQRRVVGMVTDRDICMALAMHNQSPAEVLVGDIGQLEESAVHSCQADDDLKVALELMEEHQIRRLPVLDGKNLVGILALRDVVLDASARRGKVGHPTYSEVTKVLQGIGAPAAMESEATT